MFGVKIRILFTCQRGLVKYVATNDASTSFVYESLGPGIGIRTAILAAL